MGTAPYVRAWGWAPRANGAMVSRHARRSQEPSKKWRGTERGQPGFSRANPAVRLTSRFPKPPGGGFYWGEGYPQKLGKSGLSAPGNLCILSASVFGELLNRQNRDHEPRLGKLGRGFILRLVLRLVGLRLFSLRRTDQGQVVPRDLQPRFLVDVADGPIRLTLGFGGVSAVFVVLVHSWAKFNAAAVVPSDLSNARAGG
jgi:hypothetical protein